MIRALTWPDRLKTSVLRAIPALIIAIALSSCAQAPDNEATLPPEEESAPVETGEVIPVSNPDEDGEELPANPDATELMPEPPKVMQNPDSTFEIPVVSREPVAEVPPEEVPAGPDLPVRDAVDDEFFADAAFVGNSLVDGFRLYSGLKTCDYYAATSMTVLGVGSAAAITLDNGGVGTVYQGLSQRQYGKVYILLGINEIGFETDYFKGLYATMLDDIESIQPDAVIYIMSLTPVSANKSATDSTFSMERIGQYNTMLRELAGEKGCYYVDLVEALSDETGFLPANATSDGIHFVPDHYLVWLDYLRVHYV